MILFQVFAHNFLPQNIPRNPDGTYKNMGWKSWGDFLGSENTSNSLSSLSNLYIEDS